MRHIRTEYLNSNNCHGLVTFANPELLYTAALLLITGKLSIQKSFIKYFLRNNLGWIIDNNGLHPAWNI